MACARPQKLEEMFSIVAQQVKDKYKRRIMYETIRDMLYCRRREVPNSTHIARLYDDREFLKQQFDLSYCSDECVESIDEIFKMAGFGLMPVPAPAPATPAPAPAPAPATPAIPATVPLVPVVQAQMVTPLVRTLEISAEGYQTVVIHVDNGKKIVLHI